MLLHVPRHLRGESASPALAVLQPQVFPLEVMCHLGGGSELSLAERASVALGGAVKVYGGQAKAAEAEAAKGEGGGAGGHRAAVEEEGPLVHAVC